jgi:exonuclease III
MSTDVAFRLVALNARGGGGRRAASIAAALAAHAPDVVVIGEAYPDGPKGQRLRDALAEVGLHEQAVAASDSPDVPNGVLLASRRPLAEARQPLAAGPNRQRILEARVDGLLISAAYFPLGRPKVAFWRDEFLPYAASRLDEAVVMAGDWNSGSHYLDERGATLYAAAEFASLAASGWHDAWRSLHADGREYSWYSNRGNGFRLDHAFVSPTLCPRLLGARYDHTTRETKVSDHSALVVELG